MYAISYVVLHLGIIKPMNLKLTASCLATTGEDKEIKSRQHLTCPW